MFTKALLLTILSTTALGEEWQLLEPRDVYIDAYKSTTVHDPYLDPIDENLGWGSNFVVNADLLKYRHWGLYSLNILHFDQNDRTGQIVHGGWQYELGLSLFPSWRDPTRGKLELFHQHHSRHIFEDVRPGMHFPVYDRYGVRLRIWP